MNSKFDLRNRAQSAETTLEVLEAVAEDQHLSQRGLADRLGIALGLTNAVLKRCVKKGLLKIKQVPARRYAYYLTPRGFTEKSRLTAEYLSHSLQFYRQARQQYDELFAYCRTRGWSRVVLVGATEMAEIATLAASSCDIEIVGVLEPARNDSKFCGLPVVRSLEDLPPSRRPNAVLLADVVDPQGAYDQLIRMLPHYRVLAPKLMRVTAAQPAEEADLTSQQEKPK